MTTIVTRLYASSDKANAAVAELKKNRFHSDEVFLVGPSGSKDEAAAALAQAGLAKGSSDAYADGLAKGGAAVVVHAAFGAGQRANAVLDRFEPVAVAAPAAAAAAKSGKPMMGAPKYDEKAPLSSTFGWPTKHDDATPLSSKAGWPLLSDFNFSERFGFKSLIDNPAPLSSALGWALLSDDPAPLSSKAGWPLLKDDPTPLSTKAGWPLLRD